jgi:hypothetical protein
MIHPIYLFHLKVNRKRFTNQMAFTLEGEPALIHLHFERYIEYHWISHIARKSVVKVLQNNAPVCPLPTY